MNEDNMNESNKTNDDIKTKVENWLEKEGYSLEFLTATSFEKQGFQVQQSAHYLDEKNDSNREADVIASLKKRIDDDFLVRISHVIECKWSKDKPWVVFCSPGNRRNPAACISQMSGSYMGKTLLWHMAGEDRLWDTNHFQAPVEPGFSGRQSFSNGKDLFYSSMQSVTAMSHLRSVFYDNQMVVGELPRYAEIVFPVVVVNGKLYKAIYNDLGKKIDIEETNHIRLHWSGSDYTKFISTVDIITHDYIDEFAKIREQEAEILFFYITESYRKIKAAFESKDLSMLETKPASRGFTGLPKVLNDLLIRIKDTF